MIECSYIIGNYEFQPHRNRLLSNDGKVIRLENRICQVLKELCKYSPNPVSKEHLIEKVWAGRNLSSHSVAVVISELRKAFCDSSNQPKYILTIPKKGYALSKCRRKISSDIKKLSFIAASALFILIPIIFFYGFSAEKHNLKLVTLNAFKNETGQGVYDPYLVDLTVHAIAQIGNQPSVAMVLERWDLNAPDPSLGIRDDFQDVRFLININGSLINSSEGVALFLIANNPDTDAVLWTCHMPVDREKDVFVTLQNNLASFLKKTPNDDDVYVC